MWLLIGFLAADHDGSCRAIVLGGARACHSLPTGGDGRVTPVKKKLGVARREVDTAGAGGLAKAFVPIGRVQRKRWMKVLCVRHVRYPKTATLALPGW